VPKSHVLTLRWIMRDALPEDSRAGPEFPPGTVIRSCLEAAAASEHPIRVVEDGQLLGVVDRARILASIADTIGERLLDRMAGPRTVEDAPA
jgi:glycine betaine/proline transport system ATP-binding protein